MSWLTVLPILADEKNRETIIIGIIITITLSILLIFLPFYILTSPLETLALGDIEKVQIQTIKDKYLSSIILGKGELVYKGKFPLPVQEPYIRTSPYGMRDLEGNGKYVMHRGLDIQPVHHSNIMSIADGIVIWAGVRGGYGNCIEIQHNIDDEVFSSFYAHLSKILVISGQSVVQSDIIGLEGGAKTDPNHRQFNRTPFTF